MAHGRFTRHVSLVEGYEETTAFQGLLGRLEVVAHETVTVGAVRGRERFTLGIFGGPVVSGVAGAVGLTGFEWFADLGGCVILDTGE